MNGRRFVELGLALVIGVTLAVLGLRVGALDALVRERVQHLLETRAAEQAVPRDLAAFADPRARDAFAFHRVRQVAQEVTSEWKNQWLGVPMMQYPSDLMLYQDLLTEVRPDVVVETGTASGGLSLYLATLLANLNPAARIVTVDIDRKAWDESYAVQKDALKDLYARIQFIDASSTAPETLEKIRAALKPGDKVLVLLDSQHNKPFVLSELNLYSGLVSGGSYLVVNDTHIRGDAGPAGAVAAFLKDHPEFAIDKTRDRFTINCARGGFLKRVTGP